MRTYWQLAMLVCAAVLLAAGMPQGARAMQGAKAPERPNIILILADDAGYADFGFQGSTQMQTPHLDRLAREGVVFTDAHVTASVCSPSRAGLLTGRYQQRFGYEANNPPSDHGLDPGEVTLGEALQQQGYATGAFGKWHLGTASRYHPLNQGFDAFYGILGGARSYFPYPEDRAVPRSRAVMQGRARVALEGYFTDAIGERAARFIADRNEEPFFAYVAFTTPHTPMQAKAEDLKRFQGHPRQTLAAMTWAMDRAVGRILGVLEKHGLSENTLVVFTNDNGGSHFNQSSNAPLKGAKGHAFEGGQRVPMVWRWPSKLEGGRVYNRLVSTMDIFTTAYQRAGGEGDAPGPPLDGTDLMPYLTGMQTGAPHEQLFWRKEDHAAARVGAWKLVRLEDYGTALYNLRNDLVERIDLKEEYPQSAARLQEQLRAWEAGLTGPRWHEADAWRKVTWEIHQALMENRIPRRLNP